MAAAIIFAVLSALSSAGSAVLQRFAAVDHKSKAAERSEEHTSELQSPA